MKPALDLIVRGGKVVSAEGIQSADIGIAEGKIAAIGPVLADQAAAEISAEGAYVIPGIIDAHVHFNEPGRANWEGLATGSAALAAGGGTAFFDMPLNSEPPVLEAARLLEKRALGEEKSCIDFAIWGGLVPGNLGKLEGLRDAGAIGFKAFMCASGIDSFPRVDAASLRAGMERAAKLGLPVAVHAEDDALAARMTALQRAKGKGSVRAYLDSRPVEVEMEAIRIALDLAGETRCSLQVVHVSSPEGLDLIAEARKRGVDVTAETCPHYLLLNESDVERMGAPAKCSPPIRDEARRQALWERMRAGAIDTIGSDHSPAPPEMKTSADFFEIWGGIAGCQHGFELLFSSSADSAATDLPLYAKLFSRTVARRFKLSDRKGELAVGLDADFALLAYGDGREIRREELVTKHPLSAYIGRMSRAKITQTHVRGRPVWEKGRLASPHPRGQFLRPTA